MILVIRSPGGLCTTETQRAQRLTEENNQLLLFSPLFSVPSVPLW